MDIHHDNPFFTYFISLLDTLIKNLFKCLSQERDTEEREKKLGSAVAMKNVFLTNTKKNIRPVKMKKANGKKDLRRSMKKQIKITSRINLECN